MIDSILSFLANGFGYFSWVGIVIITLVMVQITIAGVTLYLHRDQTHQGVKLHPIISHFLRFWMWLTTGMVTKEWVAIHRKHHAFCETEQDPHSPKIEGIKKVVFGGAELYQIAANKENLDRFGHGTPDDWVERNIYTGNRKLGIVLMFIIDVALFGGFGLCVWALQMAWIPFWAAGMINGTGHFKGYRNYETRDWSTNLTPIAFWIGGEELHNNHHAFPSSAKFSQKWWEFDIGWMYIRVLSFVGLAKVKKVAPKPKIDQGKNSIDIETIKSIIINRVHVMSNYGKEVIQPTAKSTVLDEGASRFGWRRIKSLLSIEHAMMDEKSEKALNEVLGEDQTLKTIYNFRFQLQQVWERAASSHENLIQALKDWCHQAEETGIKVLQDFARNLRNYVPAST